MRRHAWMNAGAILWILLASNSVAAQSQQTPNTLRLDESAVRPQATLADAGLLVGHWKGKLFGGNAEELWLPAAWGTMLGVFRLHRNDSIVFYEIMILVEEEGSISLKLKHFHPDLKGWEEKDEVVTFRLVRASPDAVWFEGLTFRKRQDGSLQGFIAVRQGDGNIAEQSFTYWPVATR